MRSICMLYVVLFLSGCATMGSGSVQTANLHEVNNQNHTQVVYPQGVWLHAGF